MESSQMTSNPLVQSVVHTSFKRATRDLGLLEFSQAAFLQEIAAALHVSGSLFEDTPDTRLKIYRAIMHGEVIAAEVGDNLAFVFYVRGSVGGRGIDVRLVCENEAWRMDRVITMYSKKVISTRWFRRTSVGAAVIVAGLLGYLLHGTQPAASGDTPNGAARTVHSTAEVHLSKSAAAPRSNAKSYSRTTKPVEPKPAVQHLSFRLREGMSLDDLSQFLKSHHLVKSAVSFDMLMKKTKADQDVRPGTYDFTSSMTEQQIIQAIKQGPSTTSGH